MMLVTFLENTATATQGYRAGEVALVGDRTAQDLIQKDKARPFEPPPQRVEKVEDTPRVPGAPPQQDKQYRDRVVK